MANYCPHCGMNVKGAPEVVCPSCGRPLDAGGGGWLSRLLQRLFRTSGPMGPTPNGSAAVIVRSQEFRIHDPETGQVKVYHSLDELPPEIRRDVEASLGADATSGASTAYTYRDSSGTEQTYRSLDEMPAELRAQIGRSREDS